MNDILIRILNLIDESGELDKDFALSIGANPKTVSTWRTGKIKSYMKYVNQIADHYDVSVDYILGKSPIRHNNNDSITVSEKETVPIPIVGNVAAGYSAFAETNIVGYERVDKALIHDGYDYAWLRVKGDSMIPLFLENDLVLIRLQDEVESGELAVVIVDEEDGVIKRVQYGANKVTLVSENATEYPPRLFKGKDMKRIRIWGKAISMKRDFL